MRRRKERIRQRDWSICNMYQTTLLFSSSGFTTAETKFGIKPYGLQWAKTIRPSWKLISVSKLIAKLKVWTITPQLHWNLFRYQAEICLTIRSRSCLRKQVSLNIPHVPVASTIFTAVECKFMHLHLCGPVCCVIQLVLNEVRFELSTLYKIS